MTSGGVFALFRVFDTIRSAVGNEILLPTAAGIRQPRFALIIQSFNRARLGVPNSNGMKNVSTDKRGERSGK